MMLERLFFLGVIAGLTACLDLPSESESGRFRCLTDSDCLNGFTCGAPSAATCACDTTFGCDTGCDCDPECGRYCVSSSNNGSHTPQLSEITGAWYVSGPNVPDGEFCLVICEDRRVYTGDRTCTQITAADFSQWCRLDTIGAQDVSFRNGNGSWCGQRFPYRFAAGTLSVGFGGELLPLDKVSSTSPLCGFCQAYGNHCPGNDVAGCTQTCEVEGRMTVDDCYFASCGVELDGICDNEEAGDTSILACASAHGWR